MNDAAILVTVPLQLVAHSRAGDKGNRSNLSLIPYRPEVYPYLTEQITGVKVLALLSHKNAGSVIRYELPKLPALNFVIDNALEGGVNDGLCLDGHGKSLSSLLLTLSITLPSDLIGS